MSERKTSVSRENPDPPKNIPRPPSISIARYTRRLNYDVEKSRARRILPSWNSDRTILISVPGESAQHTLTRRIKSDGEEKKKMAGPSFFGEMSGMTKGR